MIGEVIKEEQLSKGIKNKSKVCRFNISICSLGLVANASADHKKYIPRKSYFTSNIYYLRGSSSKSHVTIYLEIAQSSWAFPFPTQSCRESSGVQYRLCIEAPGPVVAAAIWNGIIWWGITNINLIPRVWLRKDIE